MTTGIDCSIAVWQLPKHDTPIDDKNEPVWTYKRKLTNFVATVAIKTEIEGKTKEGKIAHRTVVFCAVSTSNGNAIYEIHQDVKEHRTEREGKLEMIYECNFNI